MVAPISSVHSPALCRALEKPVTSNDIPLSYADGRWNTRPPTTLHIGCPFDYLFNGVFFDGLPPLATLLEPNHCQSEALLIEQSINTHTFPSFFFRNVRFPFIRKVHTTFRLSVSDIWVLCRFARIWYKKKALHLRLCTRGTLFQQWTQAYFLSSSKSPLSVFLSPKLLRRRFSPSLQYSSGSETSYLHSTSCSRIKESFSMEPRIMFMGCNDKECCLGAVDPIHLPIRDAVSLCCYLVAPAKRTSVLLRAVVRVRA